MSTSEDLSRPVIKSDTAGVAIPELELELQEGGSDSLCTTVEGLLEHVRARLAMASPFRDSTPDSASVSSIIHENQARFVALLDKLERMRAGDETLLPFAVVLSDPLANSFVGPRGNPVHWPSLEPTKTDGIAQCSDGGQDMGLTVEEYERTFEQNEMFGLNDLRTEQ